METREKTNLLKSKIIANDLKPIDLANKLNMTYVSLTEKLNFKREFKLKEIRELIKILDLSNDEIEKIFLD